MEYEFVKTYKKDISKNYKNNKSKKYRTMCRGGCPCGCVPPTDVQRVIHDYRKARRRQTKSSISQIVSLEHAYDYVIPSKYTIYRPHYIKNTVGIFAKTHHISYELAKSILDDTI